MKPAGVAAFSQGNTVASGVYVLQSTGPKLNTTNKIVPFYYNVPAGVQILQWRSIRVHAGAGRQVIVLDPAATGNGLAGPTVGHR